MTCLVIGPGLVGCYLGAAAASERVIPGPSGKIRINRVRLADEERTWSPITTAAVEPDVPVLVCSRIHQTPWHQVPATALAAQNGMGQPRPVAVCFFAVDIDQGVLHATGPQPRIVVGDLGKMWQPVFSAWRDAGIHVDEVKDVRAAQWEKVILNATVGPLCLSTGKTMAGVWSDASLRQLTINATREGIRCAHAVGIELSDDLMENACRFFSAVGDHRPSVVSDAGELPWVINPLIDTAQQHGLSVPALEQIATMVAAART